MKHGRLDAVTTSFWTKFLLLDESAVQSPTSPDETLWKDRFQDTASKNRGIERGRGRNEDDLA